VSPPTWPACLKHSSRDPASAFERSLFAQVEQWDGPQGLDPLTPEFLRHLTARDGCDFASTLLHRRIVQSERHGPFLRRLSEAPADLALGDTVAIVPGAFYRENPRTGADGRIVREVATQLGLPVVVAPVSTTGSLAENAHRLTQWLSESDRKRLILVSVSKGGSDVKTALAQAEAAR